MTAFWLNHQINKIKSVCKSLKTANSIERGLCKTWMKQNIEWKLIYVQKNKCLSEMDCIQWMTEWMNWEWKFFPECPKGELLETTVFDI